MRLRPSVHPRRDLPDRVRDLRGGPRDGLQNEAAIVPTATKAEFIERWWPPGCARWKPPVSCPRSGCRSSATPRSSFRCWIRTERCPLPGAGAQPGRPGAGPGRRRHHIAVFAAATETFARRNLNRSLDESLDMFAPVVAERPPGRHVGEGLRVDVLRRSLGGRRPVSQVVAVALRLVAMGAQQLSLGDTIGVATPGHVAELVDALARAGVPTGGRRRPLPRHLRPGPANTLAALESGRHHGRRLRRRPRRLPIRRERHRQPRHRGPRLAAARPRHRDRRRPRRAGCHERVDGRAAGPAQPVAGGAGACRNRRPREERA
jgi:hydroxymethylglutaryl-CoA lyase